jgi:hypothetical protein
MLSQGDIMLSQGDIMLSQGNIMLSQGNIMLSKVIKLSKGHKCYPTVIMLSKVSTKFRSHTIIQRQL